jgi:hypothetical protein
MVTMEKRASPNVSAMATGALISLSQCRIGFRSTRELSRAEFLGKFQKQSLQAKLAPDDEGDKYADSHWHANGHPETNIAQHFQLHLAHKGRPHATLIGKSVLKNLQIKYNNYSPKNTKFTLQKPSVLP